MVPRPIPFRRTVYEADELDLGLETPSVSFSWRPYDKRRPEARESYDALAADIAVQGILYPVITFRGHVLIGMRRVEIARKLGIRVIQAAEITEDVTAWTGADLPRLERLKAGLYGADVVAAWQG